ncbi:hypothetical protein ACFVVL_31720 [Kitasatospora sp. NPDC058115]|uniref:hypothetical protein n=1 Tax=Kitasatospora sp. NPDC058115 TaxID=3346347 RepID=UPI0036DD1AD2
MEEKVADEKADGTTAGEKAGGPAGETAADRSRTAAKARLVFGDPLERQSRDDTDAGWGDRPGAGQSSGRGLDWYLSQRPPHHGD